MYLSLFWITTVIVQWLGRTHYLKLVLIHMELQQITTSETELLTRAAHMVSDYSWGYDYPVKPLDEILSAEYRIGAFVDEQLVGFGTVGRGFSPDSIDNGELWIAHAVVVPEFRNQGIFAKLYAEQLTYAESHKSHDGLILSCTDNPIVEKFFLAHDWMERRKTRDESRESSTVFEYKPNHSTARLTP